MRRVTSIVSWSLKAAGARRSELSSMSPTSAMLRDGRLPEPEKMTSSMPEPRMALNELSPITQRRASTRFDLPQPFGPTTPVRPDSILNSAASQKLLKPVRRKRSNFIVATLSSGGRRGPPGAANRPNPESAAKDLAATSAERNQPRSLRNLCETASICRGREDFVKWVKALLSAEAPAVDEEGRGRVDPELGRRVVVHRPDLVE